MCCRSRSHESGDNTVGGDGHSGSNFRETGSLLILDTAGARMYFYRNGDSSRSLGGDGGARLMHKGTTDGVSGRLDFFCGSKMHGVRDD